MKDLKRGRLIFSYPVKNGKLAATLGIIVCVIFELMALRYMLFFLSHHLYLHISLTGIGMAIIGYFTAILIITYKWWSFDVYENGIIDPLPIRRAFHNNPFEKGIFYNFEDIINIYTRTFSKYTRFVIETNTGKSLIGIETKDADKFLEIILDAQKKYHEKKKILQLNSKSNEINPNYHDKDLDASSM